MSPRLVLSPGRSASAVVSRHVAAGALRAASRLLDRAAQRLAAMPAVPAVPEAALPRVEFHAEAGAPEGALYVDGQFVAYVPGVARL
jgi:hypothetical protein